MKVSVFKYLDDEIDKSERRAKYICCDKSGRSCFCLPIFYCVEENVK